MDNDKVKIDWGGVRGAQWMGASGIIGLLANAALGPGGILNRFAGPGVPPPGGPQGFVTREVLELTTENQGLKSQLYTNELDKRQSVWNAVQQGRIDCLETRVNQLYTLTQLTVPNANLNPGYGPAIVGPAPVPVPATAVPPTVQGGADAATISAIVQAVLAAEKASDGS